MSIRETYDQVNTLIEALAENHQKNMDGNKAAGGRARKAIGEIKKLVTEYRKESVASTK